MSATATLASAGSFLGDPLSDPVTRRAAAEVALIGVAGGALGCWIVHFRLSYAAESLAHSMLPGLVGAALIGAPLILGAAAGLLAGAAAIGLAGRVQGVDRDTAVAIAVTTLFGLGALMALSPESPPGIGEILFGDVLATSTGDLAVAGGLVGLTLIGLFALHHRLLAVGFDGAGSAGARPGAVEAALLVLVAVAVLVAVDGLGNLLAVASLVGPAAVARSLAGRMAPMMMLAAVLAVFSGIAGLLASYHLKIAAGAAIAGATTLVSLAVLTVRRPTIGAWPR